FELLSRRRCELRNRIFGTTAFTVTLGFGRGNLKRNWVSEWGPVNVQRFVRLNLVHDTRSWTLNKTRTSAYPNPGSVVFTAHGEKLVTCGRANRATRAR
ncbi:hypothetical protein K443DRAFT_99258, partial [Laccaria amethystina LaAM-08-1]